MNLKCLRHSTGKSQFTHAFSFFSILEHTHTHTVVRNFHLTKTMEE